jgi:large subunit ribosomal protein L5
VSNEVEIKKNIMQRVKLDKVVVHISVGGDWNKLQKAAKLLEEITGQKPIIKKAKRTIKSFGISRNQPISAMVTLRKDKAKSFLLRALDAVDYRIKESSFDENGNLAFGISEHLMLPDVRYDPEIGIFGMDIIVSLAKPGRRVKLRKYRRSRLGKNAKVTKEEAIEFFKSEFNVEVI